MFNAMYVHQLGKPIRPVLQNYLKYAHYSYSTRKTNSLLTASAGCIVLPTINRNNRQIVFQKRHYSLQNNTHSLLETQSVIYKALSESYPVELCQQFLLLCHSATGLPWWMSIVVSTIILRTFITLPLAIYQQYILAKYDNLKLQLPVLAKELQKETSIAVKLFKWDEKTAKIMYNRSMKKQWNNLIIENNCHPFKSLLLIWFQIPLWVSLSVSLRNLIYMLPNQDAAAQISYMELTVGGFGFIPNLTLPDESWILPITLGILNLMIIELQLLARNETVAKNKPQIIITNFFRVLSVMMIPISASVHSCLALYWTTSSAYGLLQNILILSPKIRRWCKIPRTVNEVQQPYELVANNLKKRFKVLK